MFVDLKTWFRDNIASKNGKIPGVQHNFGIRCHKPDENMNELLIFLQEM